MAQGEAEPSPDPSVGRLLAFTDGVVAIALTLLILPLLDGVTDAADAGLTTAGYLQSSGRLLLSLFLSFVIVTSFWSSHHRIYEGVARYNGALLWLNGAWMLTIVWLPVATALTGTMTTDALQEVLYIGTMLLGSLLLVASIFVVRRHPELWSKKGPPPVDGLAANIALTILYAVALLLALIVPGLDYSGLFLLFLTPVLQRFVVRRLPGATA